MEEGRDRGLIERDLERERGEIKRQIMCKRVRQRKKTEIEDCSRGM